MTPAVPTIARLEPGTTRIGATPAVVGATLSGRGSTVSVVSGDEFQRMATSFGAAATSYEAGRPTYPSEAVAWLLEGLPPDATVADVGAGSGKLTRVVTELGYRAVAVDPDAAMLVTLAEASPDVATHVGTAEALPLADNSVDAVVLGQAWHWVDPTAASVEVARVLRPGGVLGLIWNIRDERVDWVAAMAEVFNWSAAERMILSPDEGVVIGAPFGGVDRYEVEWKRPITRDQLEQMMRSRSWYISGDDHRRAFADYGLSEVLDGLPELNGGGTIDLPYRTFCFRAHAPA